MTDMEIKYWDLVEKQRANRAQEALKSEDLSTQHLVRQSQAAVNEATVPKLEAEKRKAEEEILLTAERTDLTRYQKIESLSNTIKNFMSWITPTVSNIASLIVAG